MKHNQITITKCNKSKSPSIKYSWHHNHYNLLISESLLLTLKYWQNKSPLTLILLLEEASIPDSTMDKLTFNYCNQSEIKISSLSNLSKIRTLMTELWNFYLLLVAWKSKAPKLLLPSSLTYRILNILKRVRSSIRVMTFLLVLRLISWSCCNPVDVIQLLLWIL